MPLPKVRLVIPQEGYTFVDGESVLRAKLGGGPSRQRLDMLGAAPEIDLSLMLDARAYQYWRAFFRTTIVEGSLPFLVDIVMDSSNLVEHEAKIVPGSHQLSGIRGEAHTVQMRLEIKALVADGDFNSSIVDVYSIYGDELDDILSLLAKLATVDLPFA